MSMRLYDPDLLARLEEADPIIAVDPEVPTYRVCVHESPLGLTQPGVPPHLTHPQEVAIDSTDDSQLERLRQLVTEAKRDGGLSS